MSENVQKLSDAWEQRPRRQLTLDDLEWLGSVVNALVRAMPEIRNRFGITAAEPPPIILPVEPGSSVEQAVESFRQERVRPEVPSRLAQKFGPGETIPSKPAVTSPAAEQSSHSPKSSRSKAGNAAKNGRKSGKRGKSASAGATPTAAPQTTSTTKPSSELPPAIAAKESGAVPPPRLQPIGDS